MADTPVSVRAEAAGDAAAIHAVHARAFDSELEARLVDSLREARAVTISQVALLEDAIVGHVLLTPVHIAAGFGKAEALGLAPIGVLPEHQRRGIGTRLMNSALDTARARAVAAVVLVGDPAYYARFGFRPGKQLGLHCKWPGTDEAFMVMELRSGALAGCSGLVSYHPLFDVVE